MRQPLTYARQNVTPAKWALRGEHVKGFAVQQPTSDRFLRPFSETETWIFGVVGNEAQSGRSVVSFDFKDRHRPVDHCVQVGLERTLRYKSRHPFHRSKVARRVGGGLVIAVWAHATPKGDHAGLRLQGEHHNIPGLDDSTKSPKLPCREASRLGRRIRGERIDAVANLLLRRQIGHVGHLGPSDRCSPEGQIRGLGLA
ncbi:MAG: hypothetical protein VB040_11670 [Propionibacterium sp.]|nr:hypothetical protein [Propionibacterium sp.]